MGTRARSSPRFAAHWVSPYGGLRLFLGVGDTREAAQEAARRSLPALGLVTGGRDTIRLTPIARGSDDGQTQRRAG